RKAEYLAAVQRERYCGQTAIGYHVVQFEYRFANVVRNVRKLLGEGAADHQFDDALRRELVDAAAAHAEAVAQHRETVGDLTNLFEKMGDVDDGDAALPQPLHE